MSFLKKLFSPRNDPPFYWIYVQCDQCGEMLRTHVNLHNDLSIRYGESERDNAYFTRKRIIGSHRCFRPIDVELTFDSKRNLLDQQIQGGRFISEEEFNAGQG